MAGGYHEQVSAQRSAAEIEHAIGKQQNQCGSGEKTSENKGVCEATMSPRIAVVDPEAESYHVEIGKHGAAKRMDLRLPATGGDDVTPESILKLERSLHAIDRRLVLGLETLPVNSIAMRIFAGQDRLQNEGRH